MKRRAFLVGAGTSGALSLLSAGAGPAWSASPEPGNQPFSWDWLLAKAEALSRSGFVAPEMPGTGAETVAKLDYTQYRDIRFRPEASIWRGENRGFTLDLFHPGFLFKSPVDINLVEDGDTRSVPFATDFFIYGEHVSPPRDADQLCYTGFRARHAINRPDVLDEFLVFQGASYFRAVGRNHNYGLSARGLAIKTIADEAEEFPLFTRFWIERPPLEATRLIVHALLDSPSVAGAYKFAVQPGEATVMEVEASLFPRVEMANFGLAPLTSMFLFDASNRGRFDDFRAGVHDSDGLQIVSGTGERIWRPLANPRELQVSSFLDTSPRGFGLTQRQRKFVDYHDYESRYDRRPSAWIEPVRDWGKGRIELVEIPTDREIHDNIVMYWRPARTLAAGQRFDFSYRLHWCSVPPDSAPVARVSETRSGSLMDGNRRLFVIDFEPAEKLPPDLRPEFGASTGAAMSVTGHMVEQIGRYRVSIKYDPGEARSAELRLVLIAGDQPWSETWLYRWTR